MHTVKLHYYLPLSLVPSICPLFLSLAFSLSHTHIYLAVCLVPRWLPTRRDCVQVEAKLRGDIRPEVLEALPV